MPKTFFDDADFQDQLTALLCYDAVALKKTAVLLKANDFRPLTGTQNGRPRWLVADRALDHYKLYREPIGRLLRSEMISYCEKLGMGERQVAEVLDYVQVLAKIKRVGPEAVTNRVVEFKREKLKAAAIQEMVNLQAAGELTDDKWSEITRGVLGTSGCQFQVSDYFMGMETRLDRRSHSQINMTPVLFIDPLDALIRGVGSGQFGMVMAPPKRGKSLWLIHLTVAYSIQRLNCLFITLEDPLVEVEDRLDAAISGIPVARLHETPNRLRARFRRFHRLIRTRLKIVDGTEEGFTCTQIEQLVEAEREMGFKADVVLVDYDDEIAAERQQKERRFEFADIYRDLRRMAARQKVIVWTAAQTQRGTENMKILAGERVAEDYSKIRKATLALSLGKGDWGEDSIYIWVAAHKFDKQHVGCNIMPDKERMRIYDRERTQRAALEFSEEAEA